MKKFFFLRCFMVCMGFLMGLLSVHASLAETCATPAAKVVSVQGTVESQRVGETQWQPVTLHDTYCPGDTIRVREKSRADVTLSNEAVLRLNANTSMTFEAAKEERSSLVSLLRGAAHFFSRRPRSLEVRTPFTVAGVRGTEFLIVVQGDKTLLSIFTGQVVASNASGSLALTSGQSAVAEAGKAPVLRVVARPRDAVHWALYYPPVLYAQPEQLKAGVDWQRQVGTSMDFYLQGDVQKAFDAIATVPEGIREPRFFTYRASLLLAVGRVEEAEADIARALTLKPNDSDALSLQTIIAVVQNDKDKALSLAQQALESDANSATTHLALSYAQQARFDLEGARASVQNAVKLDPANALAWARLAELHASFGDLSKALKAATQAVKLEPNLARIQTVLGFAYLTQVETEKARAAFAKAIERDQADPLPRLGLGLATIRDGDVTAGSREIEIAASLDPNNSLIRSYLGKAYYEAKRGKLDEREFETAKQLDPNDPTPWFYSAIAKQTTNRPVEALRDLEKAIELNDNRAVYRSKLLLDSDLAARSASQARVYSDLGFQQLALVEGWKSVNTDPTNYSAHRFLADSYAVLPRHEIARVSELLQSQLLQPINLTPIQPRLAESNLFLISAGGPGALSFNEFNPLFNRDGFSLLASGIGGENTTWAGEGVVAGIYKSASFSVGYSHFETDGWRQNADQKDNIGNAFLQVELSPQTSIQAEYRYRNTKRGDLQLNFFEDDFRPNFRTNTETNSVRFGLRHAFSPSSVLLGSFMVQHRDATDTDRPEVPPLISLTFDFPDQEAVSLELQHLFRSKYVNTVAGAGYFDVDAEEMDTSVFDLPSPPFEPPPQVFSSSQDISVRHKNFYVYSYVKLVRALTITLGVSADFFDTDSSSSESRDQFNPKFGVVWNPLPATTIRAAVFRVLKRTLITDQTLEPTQVAGFNQFYDDLNSTASWRYGVAVDQKFSTSLFGGLEFSRRDLSIPFEEFRPILDSSVVRRGDATEYLGRAYLFWTPHQWLALSGGYQYERVKNDEPVAFFFKKLTTHRMPLGLRFFHPSGFGISLKGTYFNQDGDFIRRGGTGFESASEQFWLVDAGITYRLPKRYGLITLGVMNLLDERFRFQEIDLRNATLQPARLVFARVTLSY